MGYLRVENINKSYGEKKVLNNITLDIEEGEFLCLLGPSGCGKTTLLRIIAGLEDLQSGKVFHEGTDITNLEPDKRGFGIVFQSYALFPNMTAYRNIEFALQQKKLNKKQIEDKVNEVLEIVGLMSEANKYPREMSGGQQQRIAIARAIALEPKFLLLDEPMSALDAKVRHKLRMDIKMLQKKFKITTIMVTHDQEEAITMADRIAVLNGGDLMQIGTPQDIYQKPENLFTASFIGETNCIKRDEFVFTVRPEHIDICSKEEGGYEGVVTGVEFRGSTVRIEIDCKSANIKEKILSDVSIKEWIKLNLKEKDTVYFTFNTENYIKYSVSQGA
ncbi:MAG: ATP-binding cassette domain-containing protein [Clostridium sp.]